MKLNLKDAEVVLVIYLTKSDDKKLIFKLIGS